VNERYLAEVTRAFGSLALGTVREKPYIFSPIVDRTAVWHKFIINKTFVVPPDAEGDLFFRSAFSLRPALVIVLIKPLLL
jgi:hypothetical protein